MKKYLLIIAATAFTFAGCYEDSVNKDVQDEMEAISFETFTSKQTRATENNQGNYSWHFFNHHNDFKVWGYKNTSTTLVFNADVVTVTENQHNDDGTTAAENSYNYTYSPLRYWDKAATSYEFYAAAPADGGWTFVGVGDANDTDVDQQNECYFKTSSTLTGTNLSNTSNYDYTYSFKNESGDVDKLIAAPSNVPYANFKQKVQLHFIHILSRLNVTIKKDASLEPSDHKNQQEVKLTSLVIKNLKGTGNFSEKTAAVPAGSNTRWDQDNLSNPITYTAATTTVTTSEQYVIQSLVIPQNSAFDFVALDGEAHNETTATYYATVEEYNAAKGLTGDDAKDATWWNTATEEEKVKTPAGTNVLKVGDNSKPYLVLTYTIQQTHDASGNPINAADLKPAETFVVYYNLANAFGLQAGNLAFNEGWQNTLKITINPAAIQFCADVAEWSTYERGVTVD